MKFEHRRTVEYVESAKVSLEDFDVGDTLEALAGIALKDETQKRVLELQEKKRGVMEWLKNQRTKINNGEKIELHEQHSKIFHVVYQDGAFIGSDGEQSFDLTLGELLTDASWGIDYDLDMDSVPSDIAKQYILSRAKRMLRELLNRQLVLIELDVNNDDQQKKSFSAVGERQKQGRELIAQDQGFIAEEMILNLIKKLVIDHDLPVEIEEVDVYDDVVNKVDYVIRRTDRKRGVEIDVIDEESPERIGVQFTLMFRKASMVGKRKTVLQALRRGMVGELQDLQDIAVVNVHPAYIKRSVNTWKKTRKPGGPDNCLEVAAKVDLVQKMLKDLFSENEIDEIVSEVYGVDRNKTKIRRTY
ncbi:MAG: hypothetical protein O3B64_00940 [bacterium]|nr:hypothetical protein [bacterium]